MKKIYLQPIIEFVPMRAICALCESGEERVPGSVGGGDDPLKGRAPRRTAPF